MKDLPSMICPECHQEAEEKAISCSNCGASLVPMKVCPSCRNLNRPESCYCDQCGTPFPNIPTPDVEELKSERKHVAVLFSDVNRYREIVNGIDPEKIREVTRQLFEETVKIIARYDGHVDRVLWDGVLAVFGMPHAHEDEPSRCWSMACNR